MNLTDNGLIFFFFFFFFNDTATTEIYTSIDTLSLHDALPIRYLHAALESILRDTYGVIVYQEQVMQIAQALAGYSLGDADNLRRAMGKKKKEEMAAERRRFLTGVRARGTADEKLAREIFDQMETFAAYGFNKSHSA